MEHLLLQGVNGLYVCGSIREGVSLATSERQLVAEAFVRAVAGRVPVIVQVGHNSMAEACRLAAHVQEIGADRISATCPAYFKIVDVATLVACMGDLAAAAPWLRFY